jgi:hypothetical protein
VVILVVIRSGGRIIGQKGGKPETAYIDMMYSRKRKWNDDGDDDG